MEHDEEEENENELLQEDEKMDYDNEDSTRVNRLNRFYLNFF